MRKLIKADLGRILRKKSILFSFFLMVACFVGMILYNISTFPDPAFGFAVAVSDASSWIALILGIVLVLNVYADDFKSTAYINVVGRGINRQKFIITKVIDALIILVGMYVCAGLVVVGLKFGLGYTFSSAEVTFMVGRCLNDILLTGAGIAIASVFFYLTENNTIGMLVFLGIDMVIPVALINLAANPTVVKYHIDKLYLTGACSSMTSDFIMGQTGAGLLKLFLIIAAYMVTAVVASIIIFRKKELDF